MKNDCDLVWSTLSESQVFDSRIFSINSIKRESPIGVVGEFISVNAPDWVLAIPILGSLDSINFELVMVRQFRHGSSCLSLEFPAGMVEKGEIPVNAAIRELLEETGYGGNEWKQIGSTNPNPAFMTNRVYSFLLEQASCESLTKLDHDEFIKIEIHKYKDLRDKIIEGEIDSAIMIQGFYWLEEEKRRRADSNR